MNQLKVNNSIKRLRHHFMCVHNLGYRETGNVDGLKRKLKQNLKYIAEKHQISYYLCK